MFRSLLLCLSLVVALPASGVAVELQVKGAAIQITAGEENLATLSLPDLPASSPLIHRDTVEDWTHVRLRWELKEEQAVDDFALSFHLHFDPVFWWAPHLAPEDGMVIAQHVFRSPALISASSQGVFILVPDLDLCGQNPATPWYLDFDAPQKELTLGMSHTEIPEHVLFRKIPGMTLSPGTVDLGFYLIWLPEEEDRFNPWEKLGAFLWQRWAAPLYEQGEPTRIPLQRYVEHTYAWAFDRWAKAVWQEFELDGKRVGSPAFIVNVTESPNYPGHANQREFLSIWNQAWFSSLRAASGLFRYGRRNNDEDLLRRARLTLDFTLAAPMKNGLFPTVYRTDVEHVTIDGEEIRRPKGWETGYWVNGDRVPREHGITNRWYSVLDMSWTALLLLRWHEDLEEDARILPYVRAYADRLLQLQDDEGFFPSWLDPESEAPSPILAHSPQSSMSVTFLLKLAQMTGEKSYATAALRAMDALIDTVIPAGQWEDFETYWSCCRVGQDHLGKRFERNAMFKQCSFSMFWTAEALLDAWRSTGDEKYLAWGKRTLDELSMVQQIWQPPFIHIPALGGFGVMNMDGEWNDSRQTLFAELFIDYGKELNEKVYMQRGVAALKAGFIMMYCPENPGVKKLWEKVWPFFGPEDYGFTMENYGHGGVTSVDGEGMGSFTIYTWGNGAAAEGWNRILDHHPELLSSDSD